MAITADATTRRDETSVRVVQLVRATAALREVLPRITDLVRSVARPDAIAVGEWRVVDVAAHLSHVSMGELAVAQSIGTPLPETTVGDFDIVGGAAGFNEAALEGDPERDPDVLAARIERNVTQFLDHMAGARGDELVSWLGGLVLPSSGLAGHLLGELLIHGYDISRVEGRRWPVDPAHAAIGFGFFLDILRLCPPSMQSFFLNQEKARGRNMCIDFRMRGQRRDFIVFDEEGVAVEEPSDRRVDCHVSIDPRLAMLVGFQRISTLRAALSGRVFAWGRRPWLAFTFPELIRNP